MNNNYIQPITTDLSTEQAITYMYHSHIRICNLSIIFMHEKHGNRTQIRWLKRNSRNPLLEAKVISYVAQHSATFCNGCRMMLRKAFPLIHTLSDCMHAKWNTYDWYIWFYQLYETIIIFIWKETIFLFLAVITTMYLDWIFLKTIATEHHLYQYINGNMCVGTSIVSLRWEENSS